MALETVRRRVTEAEYLAMLEASPTKLDFIDGEVIDPWAMEEGSPEAMAGGRVRHALIPINVARLIGPTADVRGCVVLTSDVKVRFDHRGDYCFPDLTAACGEVDDELDYVDEPTLVVEVISQGTEPYDRGPKFDKYIRISSLQEIVFITQNNPKVERFLRHGGVWLYEWVEGLESQIEVFGVTLRLADIYRSVKFPPLPPDDLNA